MLQDWIWLTTRKNLSKRGLQTALTYFETPESVFHADQVEYALAGLQENDICALSNKSLDAVYGILDRCAAKGIHILTLQDAAYPNRLKNIQEPPAVLYYLGTLPNIDGEPVIAVVGSRHASAYGLNTSRHLGYQISACGGIVVSGLALGGDRMAMLGALSAGRPVIGVLGGGVDVIYPLRNRDLYTDVQRYGCLISEYPPGTKPLPYNFPVRNRIISGLSLGVVVTEAPERSGTLITARYALEQGRDVFAVPGNIDVPSCAGSNRLLKEGAIIAENGWDVMQEYLHLFSDKIRRSMLGENWMGFMEELRDHAEPLPSKVADDFENPCAGDKKSVDNSENKDYIDVQAILNEQSTDEQAILRLLMGGPAFVDAMVRDSGMSAGRVLASLTLLEVKGYVKRLPGNRYQLAHK